VHGTHFQVIATRDADSDWLFHCHIIEHEALGMMATIRLAVWCFGAMRWFAWRRPHLTKDKEMTS